MKKNKKSKKYKKINRANLAENGTVDGVTGHWHDMDLEPGIVLSVFEISPKHIPKEERERYKAATTAMREELLGVVLTAMHKDCGPECPFGVSKERELQ